MRVDCLWSQEAPRLRNLQVRTTVCRRNGAPAQHAGRCQLTHSVSTRCTSPPCEIAPNAESARLAVVPTAWVAARRSSGSGVLARLRKHLAHHLRDSPGRSTSSPSRGSDRYPALAHPDSGTPAIAECIGWYNGTRLHGAFGLRSPAEFEATSSNEVIENLEPLLPVYQLSPSLTRGPPWDHNRPGELLTGLWVVGVVTRPVMG